MTINSVTPENKANGKLIAGIIILTAGCLLLLQQFNFFMIPGWLFSWPMWMIAYGVYMGGKYNFKKPIWIWVTVIGVAFLFTENIDHAERVVWPVTIIGVGAWMVTKHNKKANADYTQNASNDIK